jgi:hypothetical protein
MYREGRVRVRKPERERVRRERGGCEREKYLFGKIECILPQHASVVLDRGSDLTRCSGGEHIAISRLFNKLSADHFFAISILNSISLCVVSFSDPF